MRSIIDNAINWDSISNGRIDKNKYHYELGKAVISKETGVLTLPITLNFVMPFSDCETIKSEILSQLPQASDVDLKFEYKDVVLDEISIIRHFIPHMIHILNGPYTAFTKSINLSSFRFKENHLTLKAFGKTAEELLNANVKSEFERLFKSTFGLNIDVTFINDEEEYQQRAQNFNDSEPVDYKESMKEYNEELKKQAAIKAKAQENAPQTGQYKPSNDGQQKSYGGYKRREKEVPITDNKVMGKGIDGEANANLRELKPELGSVIVNGYFFKMSSRITKTNNYLVTILITDNTTTVCCKCFVSENKLKEMEEFLHEGDYLKIQGTVEFDTWESLNVIMIREIEKLEVATGREDTCELGKRVELHVHSKMSAMDGFNEPADIVKQAAKWGQPAVAITDHGVVQAFPDCAAEAGKQADKGHPIKVIYGVEGYVFDDSDCVDEYGNIDYKKKPTNHIIILAKTQAGLKNIYKLVSLSHVKYFYRKPRLPWSVIEAHREGLIIGSACSYGELYKSLVREVIYDKRSGMQKVYEAKSREEQLKIASRYDYLEIQPVINNRFMIEEEFYFEGKRIMTEADIQNINRRIIEIADELRKPVVATTDAHYDEPESALYRNIIMAGMGYDDADKGEGLYMRTTDEMLAEFAYLGDRAKEIVIDNTNKIADMCDANILPVPKEKYPPRIANSENTLRESCMKKVHEIYGENVPEVIEARLEKELNSIINNGYSVMYVSAQMLVKKSLSDGYLVGSRGSVGSSLAATMAGITEVNPLDPHYICPKCKHIEWGDKNLYDCGVDMPPKECPECGTPMNRNGYTIPFETFLGFNGDKEPDIDLNFAGEYQPVAHRYVGEIFGEKNVFKAGTVGTVADKTAYGYVMKYFEERQIPINKYEADRLATKCTGVKRTTGQHPGGIVIVPDDHEIYEFCPVQHPADDTETDIVTTHFDYHKIDKNLLKLDILGHDVPSMIRQLQDMTDINPLEVDLSDQKVLSIFNGIEALNIKDSDYKFTHGSYAIPEFGTPFTRQMLDDIKPNKFADLVRIAGFSHGTDVWLNNAQDYIRSGVATMSEVISTRDDIMNYLRLKGLENQDAFKIMEDVRKGRLLRDDQIEKMKAHGVPDWYIDSCNKIKYMFPRAHAVAYTMMSYRMAWYKVYYPAEFYATYFTSKVDSFDEETIMKGKEAVLAKMEEIKLKGNNASAKEKDEFTILEVAYEMYARGLEFLQAKLGESLATKFWVRDGKVQLPLVAINGVGESAALGLYDAYSEAPFSTIEEAQIRASLNKSVVEVLKDRGIFNGLPETDQLSMF